MHMVLHCVNFLPFWFNSVSWRFYVASTISFLVATWFSVVRIYHNLFNQSTVNGFLVCSHLLLVRNAVKYIILRYLEMYLRTVRFSFSAIGLFIYFAFFSIELAAFSLLIFRRFFYNKVVGLL